MYILLPGVYIYIYIYNYLKYIVYKIPGSNFQDVTNNTSFQGSENQKTLESFWHKEEEEVQRDSRLVKDCKRLIGKVF